MLVSCGMTVVFSIVLPQKEQVSSLGVMLAPQLAHVLSSFVNMVLLKSPRYGFNIYNYIECSFPNILTPRLNSLREFYDGFVLKDIGQVSPPDFGELVHAYRTGFNSYAIASEMTLDYLFQDCILGIGAWSSPDKLVVSGVFIWSHTCNIHQGDSVWFKYGLQIAFLGSKRSFKAQAPFLLRPTRDARRI